MVHVCVTVGWLERQSLMFVFRLLGFYKQTWNKLNFGRLGLDDGSLICVKVHALIF